MGASGVKLIGTGDMTDDDSLNPTATGLSDW